MNAYKVARYLYPQANLVHGDIRAYQPGVRFDYVVGNPPWEFCALTPEQQRTARERAEKNLIEWKRKIAEIKKSAVL